VAPLTGDFNESDGYQPPKVCFPSRPAIFLSPSLQILFNQFIDSKKHACCDTRAEHACCMGVLEGSQVMDGYPVDHLPVEFRPLPRRGLSLPVFPAAPLKERVERGAHVCAAGCACVAYGAGINEVIRQQQFAATISLLSHPSASPPRPRNSSMLIRCRPPFLHLVVCGLVALPACFLVAASRRE
jgi:hypothetical protein